MTKRDYSQTFAKRSNTQERHSRMKCVTRELKIKANTRTKREWLDRLFIEGKWVYNYYLQLHKAGDTWSRMPTRDNGLIVKYPTGYETRSLYTITSSMKQGIRDRLKSNEKSMLANIKNGNITHGELHYISTLDSIPLKQGCREGEKMQSYRLMDDHKHVKIQGDDRSWRVYGGHQIPRDAEIASGRLVRRNQNYYIQITFFVEWDDTDLHDEWEILERALSLDGTGLDFGIKSHITLSNGEKLTWWFEESDKLKAA